MTRARWISRAVGICFLLAILSVIAPPSQAQLPLILVQTSDTTITAGDSCWLNVYLSNFQDSIAAYQFLLRLDRPDLVQFDTLAAFDTTGTLTSGFEAVLVSDTSSTAALLLVTAIADYPYPPRIQPPLAPQGSGLLIKLPLITNANPDTSGSLTCKVDFVGPVRFVDPSARIIGQVVDTIVDTIYWKCESWLADSCEKWVQVNGSLGDYDTIQIDSSLYGYVDTTLVIVNPGPLTLVVAPPLPCDYTGDANYTVGDLTCLVSFLFGDFNSAACPGGGCDCDASGNPPDQPNVGDLTCLVAFLFAGGPPPAPL